MIIAYLKDMKPDIKYLPIPCDSIGHRRKSMKKKYAEPILEVLDLQQIDIITTSPEKGDNLLEDGYFD